MNPFLPTTVAGSYPLVWDYAGKFRDIKNECVMNRHLKTPLSSMSDHLVANAILDQLFASSDAVQTSGIDGSFRPSDVALLAGTGLDIVSTGQHRLTVEHNMCIPILRCMKGVKIVQREGVHLIQFDSEVRFAPEQYRETLYRDFEIAHAVMDYVNSQIPDVTRHKAIKLALTGPFTLLWGEGTFWEDGQDELLLSRFADTLFEMVKIAQEAGLLRYVHHIAIDEPLLAQPGQLDNWYLGLEHVGSLSRKILETVSNDCQILIHICGIVDWNLMSNVLNAVPDHSTGLHIELAGRRRAEQLMSFLQTVADKWRSDTNKFKLCLGVIDSTSGRVEEYDEISNFLIRVLKLFEFDNDSRFMVSPNCGLRGLPLPVAQSKLLNLCKSMGKVYRDSRHERKANTDLLHPEFHSVFYNYYKTMPNNQRKHDLTDFITQCAVKLNSTANALPDLPMTYFTVHSARHAQEVLRLADLILRQVALEPQELELLLLAVFAHDIGLFISKKEYPEYIKLDPRSWDKIGELQSDARRQHVARAIRMIKDREDLGGNLTSFSVDEVETLGEIICAHRKDQPLPQQRDGLAGRAALLAAILKLCDECDVTFRRLPSKSVYADLLAGPIGELSELEQHSRPHLLRLVLIKDVTFKFGTKESAMIVIELFAPLEEGSSDSEKRDTYEWNLDLLQHAWNETRQEFRKHHIDFRSIRTMCDGENCGPDRDLTEDVSRGPESDGQSKP